MSNETEKIKEERAWLIERLSISMAKCSMAQEPFDIEAHIYGIWQAAEQAHRRVHVLNSRSYMLNPGGKS